MSLPNIDLNIYEVNDVTTGEDIVVANDVVPFVDGNSVRVTSLQPGTAYQIEVVSTVVGIPSAPGLANLITG